MTARNIKNNILTVISGLMCNEGDLRRASEDRRKALEFTEEYACALMDIMMDFGEPIEERLMASILLKQYIVSYWSSNDKSLAQPILMDEIKERIKKFIPAGIGDSNRQLRLSTAHIMAHIAALDYPDRWPNMMNLVQQMLQSVSKEVVEGTVLFLKECLPYEIVTHLAPNLFNSLYEICGNEKYSTSIRATVVSLITMFLLSDMERNEDISHARILNDVGKKFCGLLAYLLSQPYSNHSDFQLKSEIIGGAFIQFLYSDKASEMDHLVLSTLPIVWEILNKCATEYIQIIGNHRAIPRDADEDEHNPKYFMKLVNNIFALVQIIASNRNYNKHLTPILSDIFYSIMIFICITPDIEQEFIEDEHSFCADEFNNMVNNTLRTDLKALLSLLVSHLSPEKVLDALSLAISKILGGCYEIKLDDSLNWRINESVMCTIGCISDIFKAQRTQHGPFNMYVYLRNASLIVTQCRNVILLARIMLVVGRFSCCMSSEQVVEHLSAICIHLRSNQHILRNAAIRALNFHCQRISNLRGNCAQHASEDTQKQHLEAFANVFNSLLDSLINVTGYLNPMIFGTTIRNICDITNMNQNLTANFASRLIPFILNTLAKNTQNALIINRCKELIVGLSKNRICAEYIQSSLLQPLLNLVSYPNDDSCIDQTESQSVALFVISVLIENVCSDALKDAIFLQGFELIVDTVNRTDDLVLSEMGTRCLCMYLVKCQDQLSALNKRRSLETILAVIYRFLEPMRDENACKHIDKIVICMFKAFHHHMDNDEKLIKCILSKLNFSQTVQVKESFNIIFLHYFYFDYELITSLLNKVPGPTGESALKHVLNLIINFKYVRSAYGKYLHILVLCKILENTLLREDTRLTDVVVMDETNDGTIKEIPLLPYVFRGIVENFLLLKVVQKHMSDDDSDEYDDPDETRVEDIFDDDQFIDLCDVLNEQVSQKEVEDYLVNYMTMFSRHASFKTLAETCLTNAQRQKLYEYLTTGSNVRYY